MSMHSDHWFLSADRTQSPLSGSVARQENNRPYDAQYEHSVEQKLSYDHQAFGEAHGDLNQAAHSTHKTISSSPSGVSVQKGAHPQGGFSGPAATIFPATTNAGYHAQIHGSSSMNEPLLSQPSSSEKTTVSKSSMRNPWLHLNPCRPVFMAFACVFALLTVALEILNGISRWSNGIMSGNSRMHYLWIFVPPFILTIVTACWGRMEFRIKQSAPLLEMNLKHPTAKRSLLLDYTVVPFYKTLYKSLQMSHHSVTAATFGTLILQCSTIASTGLLRNEHRSVERQSSFTIVDKFDFTSHAGGSGDTIATRLWPILRFNSYPVGVGPDFATQSFSSKREKNGTLIVDLDVFSAELDCEPFQWKYSASFDLNKDFGKREWVNGPPICVETDLSTSSCSLKDHCFWTTRRSRNIQPNNITTVQCSNVSAQDIQLRILITYGHTTPIGVPGQPFDMRGVICTPKYSFTRRTITQPSDDSAMVHVPREIKARVPLGVPTSEITRSIVNSMNDGWQRSRSVWWDLIQEILPRNVGLDDLQDAALGNISQNLFPSFAHVWAKIDRTIASNDTMPGMIIQNEERLCVQHFSLRFMEASLAIMLIVRTVLSMVYRVPPDFIPSSMLSYALIIARSPIIADILKGTSPSPEKPFNTVFEGKSIPSSGLRSSPRTSISIIARAPPTLPPANRRQRWQPLPLSLWFLIFVIVFSILITTALEILYHYSTKHDCLADVATEGFMKYTWTFTPTIVMSIVALSFAVIDSSTRLLQPYGKLQQGVTNITTLQLDPHRKTAILAAVESIKHKEYGLFAILLTSILGPLLAVVSSGLFVPVLVPLAQNVSVQLDDWYDYSKESMSKSCSNWDTSITDFISLADSSYPPWTYGQLAFPAVHIDDAAIHNYSNGPPTKSISARLPALRVQPNCSLKMDSTDLKIPHLTTEFKLPLNISCRVDGMSSKTGQASAIFPTNFGNTDGFFAKQVDISIPGRGPCFPDGKYHAWYFVANKAGSMMKDASLVKCAPYVEVLQADVCLTYPSYRIDTSSPPVPVESSARLFSDALHDLRMIDLCKPASIQRILPDNAIPPQAGSGLIDTFFQALIWGSDGVPIEQLADKAELIKAIETLHARRAIQILRGSFRRTNATKEDTSRFTKVVRSNIKASNITFGPYHQSDVRPLLSNLTAILIDNTHRYRLVQSSISTHLLSALLLLMVLCTGTSILLTRIGHGGRSTRGFLPREPGSMAAKMNLLAGSTLVKRLRDEVVLASDGDVTGSESLRRMEERATAALERCKFSLGWWGEGDNRRFGIDIGKAAKEQEIDPRGKTGESV